MSHSAFRLLFCRDKAETGSKIQMIVWDTSQIGMQIDHYCNVPVYENGIMFFMGQGKHYADDGYYYGQKWQCVEFIKRFYKDALNHTMPNGWGHARDFFDTRIPDTELNPKRNLLQYRNGNPVCPEVDDIMIFQDSHYGHVGIVTQVMSDQIEMIQQNIFGKSRQAFGLHLRENRYYVEQPRIAAGWLRLP